MAKRAATGTISYFLAQSKTQYSFDLWIDTLSQTNSLSGETHQSRYTRHFYPRAHMPGNYQIDGTASSQQDLQDMATFIRNHQLAMINQPVTEDFTRLPTSTGYRRLLTLSIPSEGIWIRGFVPRFMLTKRGVFEPAPKYSFEFTVVFDSHSTNIYLSQEIRKNFTGMFDTSAFTDKPPAHPDSPSYIPGVTDFGG